MPSGAFAHIYGDAPNVGPGGYLIGANLDACLYVSSSYSDALGRTVLNLHYPNRLVIRIDDEKCIRDTLQQIGLGDVNWELRLEDMETTG